MGFRPLHMVQVWKRSSRCESNGCVEVGVSVTEGHDLVHVKDDADSVVTFSRAEWLAFIDGVKAGEFDL